MGARIIGIGGGSGAGKSTLAHALAGALAGAVSIIEHDWYYRDLSPLPEAERARANFDHPGALDHDLLLDHLDALCAGKPVEAPRYDYATHCRLPETRPVAARPLLILCGLHILGIPALRDRLHLKCFVDAPAALRLTRRRHRDTTARGRTPETVEHQFHTTVEPMHTRYIDPTRHHADIVIPGDWTADAFNALRARIDQDFLAGPALTQAESARPSFTR